MNKKIEPESKLQRWREMLPHRLKPMRRSLRSEPSQEYLLYTPRDCYARSPVVVCIHGLSENSHHQAKQFIPDCERYGAVLVAPKFTARQHPDYQRLGRTRGVRADHLLEMILEEVATITNVDCRQVYLFGYSAGAQFAHRYLMARPHRVARAVIASAGWYTFPDVGQKYPYGIRPTGKLPDVKFDPEEFLRVPATVLVGEKDIQNTTLRRSERINAQQGDNRVERAKRWVAAMNETSRDFGFQPLTFLQLVPGANHSFSHFMAYGNLSDYMFYNFFKRNVGADQQVEIGEETT